MMRARVSAIVRLAVLILAFAAPLTPARAQTVEPGAARPIRPSPETEASRGATARELTKRFQRGKQALEDENFSDAARVLQSILESEEDVFLSSDSRQTGTGLKLA